MAVFEEFAQHVLLRRLDSGGQVELYEARSVANPEGESRLLVRVPAGEQRYAPWADPALAKILVHPNIVQMLECQVFAVRPFAILEFVPGLDLRELMAFGRLPIELSCFIVFESCRGLAAAFGSRASNGTALHWAHGQLCPRAIRISPKGQVKVGGFGLGRLKPERVAGPSNRVEERFPFLAPEQFAGLIEDPTPEVDVFQLGAILHALVSQEPLVAKETAIDYVHEVLRTRESVKTFSKLDGRVSSALAAVAAKMLASDPKDRFADAGEVLEALAAVPELREGDAMAARLGTKVQ